MYYRIAIQLDPSPLWQWKSTALSSLDALFQWLRLHRALPQDRLRVFSSSSCEEMNEQLVRENKELRSISVTAAQFLQERLISSREVVWGASARGTRGNEQMTSIAIVTEPSLSENSMEAQALDGRCMSSLDKRRLELERGAGGDYDIPYQFALPTAMPQVLAWVKLLVRVQQSDVQP
jgi:hypothetical protein